MEESNAVKWILAQRMTQEKRQKGEGSFHACYGKQVRQFASMNYWLSRDGVSPAQGPFAMTQLRRMYDVGELTVRAQVCAQGSDEWVPLQQELGHEEEMERQLRPVRRPVNPQQDFLHAMQRRDEQLSKSFGSVIGWLTFLMCCVAMIPVFGAAVLVVIFGFYALICSVLAVLQMVKGRAGRGVWNLILVWIAVPLMLLCIQAFAFGVFSGVVESRKKHAGQVEDERAAKRKAEVMTIISRSQRSADGIVINERPLGDGVRALVDFPTGAPENFWQVDYDEADAVLRVETDTGEVLWTRK